jgi:hypothetical protein
VQAFKTPSGEKLLLANKRNREIVVTLPKGIDAHTLSVVDGETGDSAPRATQANGPTLTLSPFAVAVVSWK